MERALSLPASLRPDPDVVYRAMGAGGVLVHLRTDVIFELNETGARVWDLIVAGQTDDAIVATLTAEFQVDSATARVGVDALIRTLLRDGLLSHA
jgi:hypothetical protein